MSGYCVIRKGRKSTRGMPVFRTKKQALEQQHKVNRFIKLFKLKAKTKVVKHRGKPRYYSYASIGSGMRDVYGKRFPYPRKR